MKKYFSLISITLIACALFLAGCELFAPDFDDYTPKYKFKDGEGVVKISIGGPANARTLSPDVSSIEKYSIEFTPTGGAGDYRITTVTFSPSGKLIIDGTEYDETLADGILVFAPGGVYSVVVTGYKSDLQVVRGTNASVTVTSGQSSNVHIIMNQLATTDPGYFDYSALVVPIDYLKGKGGTAILQLMNVNGMNIYTIDLLAGTLNGATIPDPSVKIITVAAGTYSMELTLRNGSQLSGDVEYLVGSLIQERVYIFSNMTTALPFGKDEYGVSYTFTQDDFLAELKFSGTLTIDGISGFDIKEIQLSWDNNDMSPALIPIRPGDMKITGTTWNILVDISTMLQNSPYAARVVNTSDPLYFRVRAQNNDIDWSLNSQWTRVYIGGSEGVYHTENIALTGTIYSLILSTDCSAYTKFNGKVTGQKSGGDTFSDETAIYFFDGTSIDMNAVITIEADQIFIPSPDMLSNIGFTRSAKDKFEYKNKSNVLITNAGKTDPDIGKTSYINDSRITVTSGQFLYEMDLTLPAIDGGDTLDLDSVDVTWTDATRRNNSITIDWDGITSNSDGTFTVKIIATDLSGASANGDYLTGDTVFSVTAHADLGMRDDSNNPILVPVTLGDFPVADILNGTTTTGGGAVKIVKITSSLSSTFGTILINGQTTYYAVGGNRVSLNVDIIPHDGMAFVQVSSLAEMNLAEFTRRDAADGTIRYIYTGAMFNTDRNIKPPDYNFDDRAIYSGTWSRDAYDRALDRAVEISYSMNFSMVISSGPTTFTFDDENQGGWQVDVPASVVDLTSTTYYRIKLTFDNGQVIYSPVVTVYETDYHSQDHELDITVLNNLSYGTIVAIEQVVEPSVAGKVTFNDYDNIYYAFKGSTLSGNNFVVKIIPSAGYEYVDFDDSDIPKGPYSSSNPYGYRQSTDTSGYVTYTYNNYSFIDDAEIAPKYFINAFSFNGTYRIDNKTNATTPDVGSMVIEASWTSSTSNQITVQESQVFSVNAQGIGDWEAYIKVSDMLSTMPRGTTLNNNRGLYFRMRMPIEGNYVYTPWTLTAFGGENSSYQVIGNDATFNTSGIDWDFELYRITATVTGGYGSVTLNGISSAVGANSNVRLYLLQSKEGADTNTVNMAMVPAKGGTPSVQFKYEPGYSVINDMFVYHGLDGSGYESYSFTGRMSIPVRDGDGTITGYTYRGYNNNANVQILVFFNAIYATNLGQYGTKIDTGSSIKDNGNGTTTYAFTEFYPVSQMTSGNGMWSGESDSKYCWAWDSDNMAKGKWLSNFPNAYAGNSGNSLSWKVGTQTDYKNIRSQIGSNTPYYNTGDGRDRFWANNESSWTNAYYINMKSGSTGNYIKTSWMRIWPIRSVSLTIQMVPQNP